MKRRWIIFVAGMALLAVSALALAASLKDETLDGYKLGEYRKMVIRIYGEPENKAGGELEEATGCYVWNYRYPSRGIDFEFCGQEGEKKLKIRAIRVYGSSHAKTGKSIAIGDSKTEIELKYGKLEEVRENFLALEDEECHCGLYFTMKDKKVTEILFSEMPE